MLPSPSHVSPMEIGYVGGKNNGKKGKDNKGKGKDPVKGKDFNGKARTRPKARASQRPVPVLEALSRTESATTATRQAIFEPRAESG